MVLVHIGQGIDIWMAAEGGIERGRVRKGRGEGGRVEVTANGK